MSYDTLPDIHGSAREALTTYPKFGHGTNGTEVAQTFADNVRSKHSKCHGITEQ